VALALLSRKPFLRPRALRLPM